MRNLLPLVAAGIDTSVECPLPLQTIHVDEEFIFCCMHEDDDVSVHAWSPSTQFADFVEFALTPEHGPIVAFRGEGFSQTCSLVTGNGTVLEVSLREGVVQVACELESLVLAAAWSPDGEVLALYLASHELLMLGRSMERLGSCAVGEAELARADTHVSVGWGKRETQFQGRGMKRDPTIQYEPDTGIVSEYDTPQATLSWRGDGEFVAVSLLRQRRTVCVFSRDCTLSAVSEPTNNLRWPLAWQPTGHLIAAATDTGIQFFERNGLRRYELPLSDGKLIESITWSANSAVLAVQYSARIDLYTQKNWHWYRKQRIEMTGVRAYWHPEKPVTLLAYTPAEIQIRTYQLATSSTLDGLTAVVDGDEIRVTPMKYASVPPPMAFASFKASGQIYAVACHGDATVSLALADKVMVLKVDYDSEELVAVYEFGLPSLPKLLSFDADGKVDVALYSDELVHAHENDGVVHVDIRQSCPASVLRDGCWLSGTKLVDSQGEIADFGQLCTDFCLVGSSLAFGLARNGALLFGTDQIATGVTSMLATPTHLILTTQTKLKFVHLPSAADLSGLSGSQYVPTVAEENAINEQSREIERGSLLVAAIPDRMCVVLQAPRGNLETVYPRILVLNFVRARVAQLDYKEAFRVCKVHRVDMNLLYDLDPEQFESHIEDVIQQLGTDENTDLFLSSLTDEDVTKTKYIDTNKISSAGTDGSKPGKANRLLTKMFEQLSLPCKITSLALQSPPALAEALELAAQSRDLVKHLLFLSEPNKMYRVALGIYKPRLALLVAEQAQMDPKEYLPFLKARDEEPEALSKYNIEVYLKNYEKALEHLLRFKGSTDEQIVEFVEHHGLHAEALSWIRGSNRPCERIILERQAELLLQKADYTKSGENYEILEMYSSAINAYVLGRQWRRALALANDAERMEVVARLAEAAEGNKDYGSAATLYAYFLKEPKRAIECYCMANMFDDALLHSRLHDLMDYTGQLLRESFGSFQEFISDCQQQVSSQLRRLREVREKRGENVLGFDNLEGPPDDFDNLSIAGTETTNASAFTRYTDKSSVNTAATNATRRTVKNKRRLERKKARGKKGSVYEEDYLISSTTRLVERLSTNRKDIEQLVSALNRTDMVIYAQQLITEFGKVVTALEEHLDEIFSVDDASCVRYDDSGHEIIIEKPVKPEIPALLNL